jgi:hypothetical protein
MAVDGNIYLLQPDGTVLVLAGGRIEREIVVGELIPPLTTVTRFFVTGPLDDGWIFLLDTLNERIIQVDKISGEVIQQMRVHPDTPLKLNQLTDIFVDDSGGRPFLYLVNGHQIIRAALPSPPPPFRPGEVGPEAPARPSPTVVPSASPASRLPDKP